jgi:DNA-binding NarL/FixJ family response regulator
VDSIEREKIMIRVLIADDHALLRESLKEKLMKCPDFQVVGEISTLAGLPSKIAVAQPDVVLLDLKLSDGNALSILSDLRKRWPSCKVVILTMYDHVRYVQHAMEVGVDGFVVKGDSFEELLRAIRSAVKGQPYVSASMRARWDAARKRRRKFGSLESLSAREFQVLVLLGAGLSCKEIAAQLNVSEKSVTTYRARIMKKLSLSNKADLIRLVFEAGLAE